MTGLDKARTIVVTLLWGFLVAILLLPYVKNGFWADDSINSEIWGWLNLFHTGLWDFSCRVIRAWISAGRIILYWPILYGLFYFVHDVLAVRLIDIGLFLAHVGLTTLLLRRVGLAWRTIAVFVLILLALLQIQWGWGGYDPIAAFASFCQIMGTLLTVALLLLHRWYVTARFRWLAASSIVVTLSLTCYEINVVYVPIALVSVFFAPHRKLLRDGAMVILPFALFAAVSLYLKHISAGQYLGSEVGSLIAIPITFLKQLFTTLPGSSYRVKLLIPSILGVFSDAIREPRIWAVGILWALLAITAWRRKTSPDRGAGIVIFGACMFLLVPPALISTSARYQTELTWGHGHIAVYYQYFGLALLAAVATCRLTASRRFPRVLIPAVLLVMGAYAGLNWAVNMRTSTEIDASMREPRESLEAALRKGLLDDVKDGDIVHLINQPHHISAALIYQTIQKKVINPDSTLNAGFFTPLKPRGNAQEFWLSRVPGQPWKLTRKNEETP